MRENISSINVFELVVIVILVGFLVNISASGAILYYQIRDDTLLVISGVTLAALTAILIFAHIISSKAEKRVKRVASISLQRAIFSFISKFILTLLVFESKHKLNSPYIAEIKKIEEQMVDLVEHPPKTGLVERGRKVRKDQWGIITKEDFTSSLSMMLQTLFLIDSLQRQRERFLTSLRKGIDAISDLIIKYRNLFPIEMMELNIELERLSDNFFSMVKFETWSVGKSVTVSVGLERKYEMSGEALHKIAKHISKMERTLANLFDL